MALLFLDSFDHYSTSEIAQKWTALYAMDHHVEIAAEGRIENCLKWDVVESVAGQKLDYLRYAPVSIATQTEGVCGFAIKFAGFGALNTSPTAQGSRCLFSVWGAHGSAHWSACINPDGTISLYRSDFVAATLLGATGQAVREDQWQFVEFAWTIGHVAGTIDVYVNGFKSLSFTGDTCSNDQFGASYTTQWTGIGLLTGYGFGAWYIQPDNGKSLTIRIDDFYLLDTDGGVNDAPWGDTSLGYIKPDNAGTTTQWDPTAGANYQCVDDDVPDADTTYISTDVVNELDTYSHENVAGGAVIRAVQLVASAKKGDVGANDLAGVMRIGGSNYVTGVNRGIASTSGYNFVTFPVDESPATTSAWGEAEVNAAEFGPKKIT